MTGHGNVFSDAEISNLNKYMVAGGFLHIDYGMDQYIRKEIKKIFPNNALIEIPSNHFYFRNLFFSSGLPKSMNMTENVHLWYFRRKQTGITLYL
jgi:hypothetical protein